MSTTKFEFYTHVTRQICHLCNGDTGFEMCAEWEIEGWGTFRVCACCLKAGQKQVDGTLRKTIAQMHHRARECEEIARALEGLIGNLRVPSRAAWQAQVDFRNAAWEVEDRVFAEERLRLNNQTTRG
jgi:hypothetical protein